MKVVIVGRGKVGTALARALRGRVEVALVRGRAKPSRRLAEADVVLLCVPDARIATYAEEIGATIRRGCAVLHVAGARSHEELGSLRAVGAAVGAMHPMVSFAPGAALPGFEGTVFVVGGDERAVRAGRRVAKAAGARAVVANVHGPVYHAAAALAANGAVGLAHQAVKLLVGLGLERRDAELAIGGILGTVAHNVRTVGVPAALTGPIVRGDGATVERHRRLLASTSDEALSAYDGSARTILACARDAGLDAEGIASVTDALAIELTPPRPAPSPRRAPAADRPRR